MSARDVARRVLARVEQRDDLLRVALDDELGQVGLEPADRALATELAYGVTRHKSRLDRALDSHAKRGTSKLSTAVRNALRVAAFQILLLERVPAHAAVDDAVSTVRRIGGARLAGFANGLLRALARGGEGSIAGNDFTSVARRESMPDWILEALAARVTPQELAVAAAGLNARAAICLRVNSARASVDEVLERLAAEVPGARVERIAACDGALAVKGLGSPLRLASFAEGLWTVQDVGAQWVAEMVSPGARSILDGCAGVGGKALQLASRPGVHVVATDPSAERLVLLEEARKRLGVAEVETHCANFDAAPEGPFDTVLVDAPCTGLGILRRHPERKWRGGPDDITEVTAVQREVLAAAASRVRPGGELVFAVCTFVREEGPEQVERFLSEHPEFSLARPSAGVGRPPWQDLLDPDGSLSTWPHVHGADAFYAVRLVRGG